MKVIVVEDILPTLDHLVDSLSRIEGVTVVGAFSRPSEALARLSELSPDAAFLDVDLPGMSGIDLARRIHLEDPRTGIVFVTAHPRFAVDAFSVEALDYLLKPIEAEDLLRSVNRIRKAMEPGPSVEPIPKQAEIRVFGGFQVKDAKGVPVRWFSVKHEELLAYLLLNEHPVSKWTLAEMLWPESDAGKSDKNFDMTLFRIRTRIRSHNLPIRLAADKGRYRIELGEGVFFDWKEVRRATRTDTVEALEAALRILDGEFLSGSDFQWTEKFSQYALWERRAIALRLMALFLSQGRHGRAYEVLHQALRQTDSDPTLASSARNLLRTETQPAVQDLFHKLLDES